MPERSPFDRDGNDVVIVSTGSICSTGRNPQESYDSAVAAIEDGTYKTGLRELRPEDLPNFDQMAEAKGITAPEERAAFFRNAFKCGAGGVIPAEFFPNPEENRKLYPDSFFRGKNQLVGTPIVQAYLALKQIQELLPELFADNGRMRSDMAKRTMIDVASGAGFCVTGLEEQFMNFLDAPNNERLGKNYRLRWLLQNLGNMAAAQLASAFGIKGSQNSSNSACSASGISMINGMNAIRAAGNNTDIAIVGGSEYVTGSVTTMIPFDSMGAFSRGWRKGRGAEHALTSFGADRDGFVPGDAAGLVVLMRRNLADHLGIEPLATVHGVSTNTCQPLEFTGKTLADGTVTGQSALMEQLFENIGLQISAFHDQLVHFTHGTGTEAGAINELNATAKALGRVAREGLYVGTGNKERIGHTLGAAFIMSVIDAVEALRKRIIAGLPSTEKVDPLLKEVNPDISKVEGLVIDPEDLRATADGMLCRRNEKLAPKGKTIITSMGFGGTNASALVGEP